MSGSRVYSNDPVLVGNSKRKSIGTEKNFYLSLPRICNQTETTFRSGLGFTKSIQKQTWVSQSHATLENVRQKESVSRSLRPFAGYKKLKLFGFST